MAHVEKEPATPEVCSAWCCRIRGYLTVRSAVTSLMVRQGLPGRKLCMLPRQYMRITSAVPCWKAMNRLKEGKTSFVNAHRLSTIRDANMILVMNSRGTRTCTDCRIGTGICSDSRTDRNLIKIRHLVSSSHTSH